MGFIKYLTYLNLDQWNNDYALLKNGRKHESFSQTWDCLSLTSNVHDTIDELKR